MSRPKSLNFITSSAGKIRETTYALDGVVALTSRGDVLVDEIQGSIVEIARDKCSRAAALVSFLVLFCLD